MPIDRSRRDESVGLFWKFVEIFVKCSYFDLNICICPNPIQALAAFNASSQRGTPSSAVGTSPCAWWYSILRRAPCAILKKYSKQISRSSSARLFYLTSRKSSTLSVQTRMNLIETEIGIDDPVLDGPIWRFVQCNVVQSVWDAGRHVTPSCSLATNSSRWITWMLIHPHSGPCLNTRRWLESIKFSYTSKLRYI